MIEYIEEDVLMNTKSFFINLRILDTSKTLQRLRIFIILDICLITGNTIIHLFFTRLSFCNFYKLSCAYSYYNFE